LIAALWKTKYLPSEEIEEAAFPAIPETPLPEMLVVLDETRTVAGWADPGGSQRRSKMKQETPSGIPPFRAYRAGI
jgi:hypothetical protein